MIYEKGMCLREGEREEGEGWGRQRGNELGNDAPLLAQRLPWRGGSTSPPADVALHSRVVKLLAAGVWMRVYNWQSTSQGQFPRRDEAVSP